MQNIIAAKEQIIIMSSDPISFIPPEQTPVDPIHCHDKPFVEIKSGQVMTSPDRRQSDRSTGMTNDPQALYYQLFHHARPRRSSSGSLDSERRTSNDSSITSAERSQRRIDQALESAPDPSAREYLMGLLHVGRRDSWSKGQRLMTERRNRAQSVPEVPTEHLQAAHPEDKMRSGWHLPHIWRRPSN